MKIKFIKNDHRSKGGVFITCYKYGDSNYNFIFSKKAKEKFILAPGDRLDIGIDEDTGNIILVRRESGVFTFRKNGHTVMVTSTFLGRSLGLKGKERFECTPVEGHDNYIQIVIPKEYKFNIPSI